MAGGPDPVTLIALRRLGYELSVGGDTDLAKLGSLVVTLVDGLVSQARESIELFDQLIVLVHAQTDEMAAMRVEMQKLTRMLGGTDEPSPAPGGQGARDAPGDPDG